MSRWNNQQTVDTFSLRLTEKQVRGNCDALKISYVDAVEREILGQLQSPVRLLRWAIVKLEGGQLHCEGAYLKNE